MQELWQKGYSLFNPKDRPSENILRKVDEDMKRRAELAASPEKASMAQEAMQQSLNRRGTTVYNSAYQILSPSKTQKITI